MGYGLSAKENNAIFLEKLLVSEENMMFREVRSYV